MVNINRNGSCLVIEFTDNDKYLFNGKMEVAQNELMIVLDDTEFVTFRRMATGDVLFGQNVEKIKINGVAVNKDNIIDKFAELGFGSPFSKGVVTSVNNKTGDVVITAETLNVYTKDELENKMYITNTVDNLTNYYNKTSTYNQQEVNERIGAVSTLHFEKVATLPEIGENNIIYLVPKAKTKKSNIYEEWIYVDNSWELIGTTDVNLDGYLKKEDIPTFDATELFTKSQDLGTLTPEFRLALDAALIANKLLFINDAQNNVFAVITFISKGDSFYSFQAVSSEVSYSLRLDINANTVTIKLAAKGYGFNKYETEYPVSVFELSTQSTNNDIQRAFSSNDNGVVIPSSGDVFEVREPGAVSGMVIRDSGIVTSRVETNGKIDLVLVSNNLVEDYIVVHSIKLNYNAAQGVDSLAVDKVVHSVIDPALLALERQATLVSRAELKTINGQALVGEGDIAIGGVGQVDATPDATEHGEIFNSYEGDHINKATGSFSHAEGYHTTASGDYGSHVEGFGSLASGYYSHAEGLQTTASGSSSHAEGAGTTAAGGYSHAEGYKNTANGIRSHVEGSDNTAEGWCAHVEGRYNTTVEQYSHAEGFYTTAKGTVSHAEGNSTIANGTASHSEGFNTVANNDSEHAEGKYNKSNTNTISSIGVGTSDGDRKNAVEVHTDGSVWIKGIGTFDGTNPLPENSVLTMFPKMVTLTQLEYDLLPAKDANTYYFIKEA